MRFAKLTFTFLAIVFADQSITAITSETEISDEGNIVESASEISQNTLIESSSIISNPDTTTELITDTRTSIPPGKYNSIEQIPGWDRKLYRTQSDEESSYIFKSPKSYKNFYGLKFRIPSKLKRCKYIAHSSKYSDIFNAFNYASKYYTFKISADFLTPPILDISIFTTLAPAFWFEKSDEGLLERKRNLSISYTCLIMYNNKSVNLSSGVSGIFFTGVDNAIGCDRNHLNYNLNMGLRVIKFTHITFLMRCPVTKELEEITESNYSLLLVRKL